MQIIKFVFIAVIKEKVNVKKLDSDSATYSVLLYITGYLTGMYFEVQNEKDREVTYTECLFCANTLLLIIMTSSNTYNGQHTV